MNGDELYALDPSDFVAARNQMVKDLRAHGDKEGAGEVAKLRRPPATAWALNRLARDRPEFVDAALDAGARLRTATERALEGDASDLRAAQADERAAVEAAISTASDYLDAAGHASPDRSRQLMAGTLRAAAADESVAERLRVGALDADREAPGLGLDGLAPSNVVRSPPPPATPPPTAKAATKPASRSPSRLEEKRQDEERRRQARAKHAKLVAEADRLEREARHLRAQADGAETRAVAARAAADAARVPDRQRGSRPGG